MVGYRELRQIFRFRITQQKLNACVYRSLCWGGNVRPPLQLNLHNPSTYMYIGQALLAAIMRWSEYSTTLTKYGGLHPLWHKRALLYTEYATKNALLLIQGIIKTNGINVDEAVDVVRTLTQTDILVPGSLPELLGAVGLSQYTLYEKTGWHRERGAMADCRSYRCRKGPLRTSYRCRGLLRVSHIYAWWM